MPTSWSFVGLAVVVVSTSVFAGGNRVGNGGHVVVCPERAPQMLDLWEAEVPRNLSGTSNQPDAFELAKQKADRLKSLDPKLHRTLTSKLESLKHDIEWKKEVDLTLVEDSLHLSLPQGCKLVQAAIRKNDANPEKRFLIQKDLWEKLSLLDQSALLNHEALYDYFYKLGETDSRKVRLLIGKIYGEKEPWANSSAYWKWVQAQRLALYP